MDQRPNKEITLGEWTGVHELAMMLGVSDGKVIEVALREFGLLTTTLEPLSFDRASTVARAFGYTARRRW